MNTNRKGNVSSSTASARVSPTLAHDSGFNFIHFGCWNNDGCGDKYVESGLTKTMRKLKLELPKINPEIVLVTGDNYYPLKTKIPETDLITKEFNKDAFDSGWSCLQSTLPPEKTYILLGNHDLEEKGKKEKKAEKAGNADDVAASEMVPGKHKKDKSEKEGKSEKEKKEKRDKSEDKCIIKDELGHINGFNLVDLCEVKIIGSTMFVMFMSTVYDTDLNFNPEWESLPDKINDKENPEIEHENPEKEAEKKAAKKNKVFRACSKYITDFSGEEFRSADNLTLFKSATTQKIWAKVKSAKSYNSQITNLVFVCHEPLVSWKSKTKKDEITGKMNTKIKLMTFGGEEYMEMLCEVIDTVKPKHTYYLCADLHQYQSGVIDINCAKCEQSYQIIQDISGTGGAEQDDQIVDDKYFKSKKADEKEYGKYSVEYTMSKSDKRFGFTKGTVLSEGGIGFEFIPVTSGAQPSTSLLNGGGRTSFKAKKTAKRRIKYVFKTTCKK